MSRRHRHRVASPSQSSDHSVDEPCLGYILEWTAHTRHRHYIVTNEEMRQEVVAGECAGLERLLVVRSLDAETIKTLKTTAGVEGEFIEAHLAAKTYRPRGRSRGVRWWSWNYPEMSTARVVARYLQSARGPAPTDGTNQVVRVCRASLWLESQIPILLLDQVDSCRGGDSGSSGSSTPRPRRLDAATHPFPFEPSGRQVAPGVARKEHQVVEQTSAMEGDLWDVLRGESQVEEILGELVYDHWVEFLAAMKPGSKGSRRHDRMLWDMMTAMEQNLDDAKYQARQGRDLDTVNTSAWTDLTQRMQFRINMRKVTAASEHRRSASPAPASPLQDPSDRSLDRITYLGGLLLPVTVVAGVLAIDGDYGPRGHKFWVFWISSLLACAAALLVIYVDQVGTMEVWTEVMGGSGDGRDHHHQGDADDMDPRVPGAGAANYLVQKLGDGTRTRTWHRSQLGWKGAVKKVSGYYRWRGVHGMVFERPDGLMKMRAWGANEAV